MAENKWIIDGHHYTCPDCKKTIAIVVNESDEDFEFCPFCGKRMSGQMAKNKMAEVAKLLGQKINKRFTVEYFNTKFDCIFFISVSGKYEFKVLNEPEFSFCFTEQILYALITGRAVIVSE